MLAYERISLERERMSVHDRYCCKGLFALAIKNFPGCRRDFRVKMWGTSSPVEKLADDLLRLLHTTDEGWLPLPVKDWFFRPVRPDIERERAFRCW